MKNGIVNGTTKVVNAYELEYDDTLYSREACQKTCIQKEVSFRSI